MNKKKISLFVSTLAGGGAEKIMLELGKEFLKTGFNVDLILIEKKGPYLKEVPDNIKIVELGESFLSLKYLRIYHLRYKSLKTLIQLSHLIIGTGILFSVFPLMDYLKKKKPDVLLSTLTEPNIIAILAKMIQDSDCRLVIRIANYFSYSLKRKRIRLLAKSLYQKTGIIDKIIAISQGVKDDLTQNLKIPSEKISVVYNPINLDDIIIKKNEEVTSLRWLNYKRDFKVVLGVGRFVKQKALDDLVRAFYFVRQSRNVKLIILGEGEERTKIADLIKTLNLEQDVYLPGFVDNPYAYISKVDVFVLSSKWEGFGNVILESLSCGTSVVSTDCPSGPSEILENGKYGKLIPVGDINAMAKAIESVLETPFNPELLKRRAADFDKSKVIQEYLKFMFTDI